MGDFPGGPEVRLPMQGSLVRSLVREDPTCHRATKTLQLLNLCSRAQEPQLLSPSTLEPMLHNKRSHSNEKQAHCNETAAPTHCNYRKPLTNTGRSAAPRPHQRKNKMGEMSSVTK